MDSGTRDSGMTATDSGPMVDAGPGTDAGPMTDAGPADSGPVDSGPPDSGPGTPDAGPPPPCSMGRIRIQDDCGSFTACGGDIEGNWCYSDVCITPAELTSQLTNIPGIPSSCNATEQDKIEVREASGEIDGTITVTASTIARMVTNTTQGTFWAPTTCIPGGLCSLVGIALGGFDGASGSCSDETVDIGGVATAGCVCDITFSSGIGGTPESYTLDGNTAVVGEQRLDYCVSDGNLVFRDNSAMPEEPGTQTALPDGA